MRLTTEEFWKSRPETHISSLGKNASTGRGLLRRTIDRVRLRHGAEPGQSYNDFAIQQLLTSYLPVRPDWRAIEIGCAPGDNLARLHRMFGYIPYGIEYTHSGVLSTLDTFRRRGLDTANITEADFFDGDFHERFRGNFDVVFSDGFVEHFDPPCEVLRLHVNLLKTGGYLICIIPNLLGVFYPFLRLCALDLLERHNCKLMGEDTFRRMFEPFELDVKFCGYVGAPQFYGSSLKGEASLRGVAAAALDRAQDILDLCMFMSNWRGSPGNRMGASLVFVGQRIHA